jgi:hypothetical protein
VFRLGEKSRRKLAAFLFVTSFILFALGIYVGYNLYTLKYGNPSDSKIVRENVTSYLKSEGFQSGDFIGAHYAYSEGVMNPTVYHGQFLIRFKDEPKVVYDYGVLKGSKKVVQFCQKEEIPDGYDTSKLKHNEKSCISIYAENVK